MCMFRRDKVHVCPFLHEQKPNHEERWSAIIILLVFLSGYILFALFSMNKYLNLGTLSSQMACHLCPLSIYVVNLTAFHLFVGQWYNMTCFGLNSSVGVYAVGFTTCFCLLALTFLVPLIPNLFSFGRSEFVFINPNSKGQCGCGESFMTTGGSGATKKV